MKVRFFGTVEGDGLKEKTFYGAGLISFEFPRFFSTKIYGSDVISILYNYYCGIDPPEELTGLLFYRPRKKHIMANMILDFPIAARLSPKEFHRYVVQKILETTLDFEDLKLKNFDLNSYIKDLEHFFDSNDPNKTYEQFFD